MRILFLTDNFPPERNAPATRTYEHAAEWVKAGHQVTVITCAPNFPEGRVFDGYQNRWYDVQDVDGIRVVRVKTYISANAGFLRRTLDFVSFMVSGGVAALFEERPDILISTSPQFFCAIAGWAVSRLRQLPWVFELRDLWPESIVAVGAINKGFLYNVLSAIELRMYRSASAIVSVTSAFKRQLVSRGIAEEKIHVVLNGVNLDIFSPRDKDEKFLSEYDLKGKFVVGYLGTLGMAHALDKVLDTAALMADNPDVVFIIAGAGARKRELTAQANRLELKNVRFIPAQDRPKMPALWSIQDLALITLQNSPLFETVIPSKIYEAMGMGIPMIVSVPAGEATKLVESNGAGVAVPAENVAALADQIISLYDEKNRLRGMSECSLSAAKKYSRTSQAKLMLATIKALTAEKPASSALQKT